MELGRRGKDAGESMEKRILGNYLEGRQSLVLLLFVEGKEGAPSFAKKDLSWKLPVNSLASSVS